MNRSKLLLAIVAVAGIATFVATGSPLAIAQTTSPTYQSAVGTYVVVSPKENYVWRLNTVTGDLIHCYNGPGGVICKRAAIPAR